MSSQHDISPDCYRSGICQYGRVAESVPALQEIEIIIKAEGDYI